MPVVDEEAIVNAVVEAVRERLDPPNRHPSIALVIGTDELPRLVGQIAGAAIKAMRDMGADEIHDIDRALDALGVPWGEKPSPETGVFAVNFTRAERVRWAARNGAIRIGNRQRMVLERCGEALHALFKAMNDGDVVDVHYPEQEETPHAFEPPLVGDYCRRCGSADPHPLCAYYDCPEDDTCTCASRAVFKKLQAALDMIEGRRDP